MITHPNIMLAHKPAGHKDNPKHTMVANLAREEKAEAKLNPKTLGWSFLAGPWDHHVFQQVTEADIRTALASATIPLDPTCGRATQWDVDYGIEREIQNDC